MTLKVTQGHRKLRNSISVHHFPLVMGSNNVSILHRFGDVTTSIVTSCDLKKSVIFNVAISTVDYIHFSIPV